jgi:hypothetical protein
MDLGFVSVPSILIICYLTGMIVKMSPISSKFIPPICGVLGGILGAVALFCVPEVIGSDPLMAVAIGIASGLAATGANEVGVQLKRDKGKEDKEEGKDKAKSN